MAAVAASLVFGPLAGAADAQSPVGLWLTIDDATNKPRAQVRIVETNGVLSGRIVKTLNPEDKPEAVCDRCTDERKGQPIIGMTILRNLKKEGDR